MFTENIKQHVDLLNGHDGHFQSTSDFSAKCITALCGNTNDTKWTQHRI